MRLYHYTSRSHAEQIIKTGGITLGAVPIPSPDGEFVTGLVPGVQWLTADPDWDQGWATRFTISEDRTECRFVVFIPLLERHELRRWDQVAIDFGYTEAIARRFAALGGDSKDWYVFPGPIPTNWLIDIEGRPHACPEECGPNFPARGKKLKGASAQLWSAG